VVKLKSLTEFCVPDLLLYNGKLHTQDSRFPAASAVAIQAGRILAVGADQAIRDMATLETEQIDLQGRRVLPGLTDAHFHFYDWALGLKRLSLAEVNSRSNLQERLAKSVGQTPAGEWILGQGWNESRWPQGRMPTRTDLDSVSQEHPIILWRNDLHLAVANTAALRKAGISAETPDPAQGVIGWDPSGQPNGILKELAINLVTDVIPPPSEEETVSAMQEGFSILHRLGLTGVHDFRLMGGADGPPAFRAYQRLAANGDLNLRMWMQLPGELLDEAIALGLRTGMGDDVLRVGQIKLFSDGGQGARTAWMLAPYKDTGDCGMPLTPMSEIAEAIRKADAAGLAVAIHAIGDRANRELIDVFEQIEAHNSPGSALAPDRIEHVQVIHPDDVRRLGRLNVVASVQPIHCPDDIPMIEESIGERGRRAYPFRDMLKAGTSLALGTDCPVASPNPFWTIHAAVTRQGRDGTPQGGWYPSQRLSVFEAVWGYTMGPAVASGQEALQGSLSPGKFADLVVLDSDIFEIPPEEIPDTKVDMTVFAGRIVHRR
jgi:hypothetical protein